MVCFVTMSGFLLREIKDFWRVALLTSLLLSTVDGMNEGQDIGLLDFQLDKMRESYLTIEETIRELGKLLVCLIDCSIKDEFFFSKKRQKKLGYLDFL